MASGTNDLANQAAFDMASKHDPDGKRTVGIIIKCDAAPHVDQASNGNILETAIGNDMVFRSWTSLRIRKSIFIMAGLLYATYPAGGSQGINSVKRARREKLLFASEPWNLLDKERRGTDAVKEYLTKLLSERIEKIFPTLLHKIHNLEASTEAQLARLGPPRKELEDKRAYLATMAQDFHSLALQALRGRYDNISHGMRLRRIIRDANDSFTSQMIILGHCVPFLEIPKVMILRFQKLLSSSRSISRLLELQTRPFRHR